VSGTVNVTASASDNVGVTRVEFLLDGAVQSTDTTAPYSWSWNTTTTANGAHTLVSRAFDAAGNPGSSAAVGVTVSNLAVVTAAFDTVLQAPRCSTVGSGCDSGAALLLGRDGRGPEPNQPNTINDSCADGTSGTFHSDESNDRLRIETLDGTALARGKQVRITATVWAWTTPSSDRLDLYFAANAASPTWTLITTLTPAAAGAQTLTATFTLPTGSTLQAIRAQFRYTSTSAACAAGGYNDRDDLVFAVQ
jgi:leucyl aminopeptidase